MTTKRLPDATSTVSASLPSAPERTGGANHARKDGVDGVNADGANVDGIAAYAGAFAFDQPSFFSALCRYRERHGLMQPQAQVVLDDADLNDLRDHAAARDFAFDADILSPLSPPTSSKS